MNRLLVIPAACCLIAFAALLAALQGAVGHETGAESTQVVERGYRGEPGTKPLTRNYLASDATRANDNLLMSSDEAQQVLTRLAGDYLRPWRQWESSSHRLYSRAAPRPIPSISAGIELASSAAGQSDGFLLATITVTAGARTQPVPCVVDRTTKQVRLFAEGQWQSEKEWVMNAPLP